MAHEVAPGESAPLLSISGRLPEQVQARYDELIEKRWDETLTPDEHRELLELTEAIEIANAKRIEVLAHLARLRQISLPDLMDEWGLKPPRIREEYKRS